ncbi:MAG TPA: DUF177 domain-containing protein [Acidimicrobiales bacterium]|nr:DUF177 domain-containing protein [Acidimicrobiales bacterium]
MSRPFLVPTGELFRRRGERHRVTLAGPLPGLALSTSRLADGDVVADLVLEAQGDTVTVSGTVAGDWTGECRRCLEPTGGRVVVEVSEVFEPDAVEGETYPLGTDTIDLEPALREALALALPVAPLCDEACAGPDPAAHPVTTAADDEVDDGNGGESNGDGLPARDPRWGALDALRFDT